MASRQWSIRLAVPVLLGLIISTSALSIQYCSNLNTASGSGNFSLFQSNGLCYNFCNDYSFAVLQGADCWCSDYVPGSTTSKSDCNSPCNGYPDDLCGNEDNGLFGYIPIPGNDPSGTKGASTAAPSSSQETTSPDSNTVFITVTPDLSSESTSTTSSKSTSTLATTSTPTSESSSMTWTPTPVISLETITGQVHTVTVTPTTPPNAQITTPIIKKKNGGLSTGGAVGLTIGLVALVALVCGIIYFCWRRREKEKALESSENSNRNSSTGLNGPLPVRTMSENSRFALSTDGRQVINSFEPEIDVAGSRRSRLMPVDPRLNPHTALYQRDGSKSRESVNTIRDDHDYSRPVHQLRGPVLRATNPDE